MTDPQQPSPDPAPEAAAVPDTGPAHRFEPKTLSLSVPVVTLLVGVVSFVLVLATLLGYQLSPNDDRPGPSLAESAAAAGQPPSLAQEADDAGQASAAPSDAVESPGPEPDPDPAAAPKTRSKQAIEGPAKRGMLHVKPTNVVIPKIGVISDLVKLGLNPDNSLQVPEDYSKAGWFTQGSYPGDLGGPPALIVGHVDNKEGPAVFYALDQLKIGDEILVGRADGSTAVFVIYDGQQFPKDTLPTEELYGERKGSELVLITCTGEFNPETGHYLDNYVVRAKLDTKRSKLAA